MGTRNLTQVKIDGQIKVAQYCQWDGYPTGQGRIIADFLAQADLDAFADRVRKLQFISAFEANARTRLVVRTVRHVLQDANPDWKWVNDKESEALRTVLPELHRDTGARILDLIMESDEPLDLRDSSKFLGDILFCEWAYLIDLDTQTVTVTFGYPERQQQVYTFGDFTPDALALLEEEEEEQE